MRHLSPKRHLANNPMRRIIAIIKPFKLQEVRAALRSGVKGMTITEVEGYGNQKGHTEKSTVAPNMRPPFFKVKLEVVVPASLVERVVEAIARSGNAPGQIGDGKIFVEASTMLYESGPAKQMTQRCEPRASKSSGAQTLGLAQVRVLQAGVCQSC